MTHYVFVTGGVCSSLGKGLTAASIGLLLEKKGLKIAMLKLDPYLNVDPGTMSPYQHGEVYVTDDGAETDLDLGHYFRYTHSPLSRASSTTSGQIYNTVIKRERHGDYLGKTVQVIPHITDEIKARIVACGKQEEGIDVVIAEIGGTVGDIESLPFLEAIRQFRYEHQERCLNIHLTYVPYLKAAGEVKTKPSQQSVQLLRGIGIFPDILVCRSEMSLADDVKDKISLFCNVKRNAVIEEVDVETSIYEVPIKLHEQGIDDMICGLLKLPGKPVVLKDWENIIDSIKHPLGTVTVGLVGKYVQHQDAYKSVYESLKHAAIDLRYAITIKNIEADKVTEKGLSGCDGYLVPGGFGERGWLGKIMTAKHCREKKIPYFGICLGMQVMAVEFARHVAGFPEANSTEIDPDTKDPVISLLSEQKEVQDVGGTMRLGAYRCLLKKGSHAHKAYGKDVISERHRHRYEFNNKYLEKMEKEGFQVTGILEGSQLCEISEIKGHPWMVGVQFHPEFQSKPTAPHPLFREFVRQMIEKEMKPTRIVGLDWGVARIGVALSDERKIIATPLKTIKAEKKSEATVKKILDELLAHAQAGKYDISEIIVGMPLMMSGKSGFQADEVKHFIEAMQALTPIPIKPWDERLTTSMAERSLKESSLSRKKRSQVVDSIAAIIILQNYLDHLYLK